MTRVLRQTEAWLEARQKRNKTRQDENGHIGVATKPQKARGGAKAGQIGVSEHTEQVQVIQWWDLWGPANGYDKRLLYAIPNAGGFSGGFRHNVGRVAKLKAEGVRPAVPDLFLSITRPILKGSGLYIEMKRVKGKARKDQESYHELLRSQGYRVVTCQGFGPAQIAIMEYLLERPPG